MTEPLNQIERRVYDYLIDFLAEHTYQPSIREIGRRFRIKSTKTVSDILQALARKGFIERDPSRSRGVRLVGYTGVGGTMAVPYHASLGAHGDLLAEESRAGHLVLDRRLAASDRAFLLRVDGGLRDACVLDGDYVVVDPTGFATDGALVAARVGTDARVGTWHSHPQGYALRGIVADRELGPHVGDDVAVLGVVTSVIRSYSTGDPLSQPLVSQTSELQ